MKKLLFAALMVGSLMTVRAEQIPFTLTLDGAYAGTGSTGTGTGLSIFYDTDTDILSLVAGYGGGILGETDLEGDFTVSHIHNVSDSSVFQGLNNTPLGGAKSGVLTGTIDYSGNPAAEAALFATMQYVNVHSSTEPGGEIAGLLVPVPEPSAMALVGMGLASLVIFRRKR